MAGLDRRVDQRHGVALPAILRAYRMAPREVVVTNISASGSMVRLDPKGLAMGDEVVLAAGGLELVSTIAWIAEGHLGLSFHRRLSPAELAAIRLRSHARPR